MCAPAGKPITPPPMPPDAIEMERVRQLREAAERAVRKLNRGGRGDRGEQERLTVETVDNSLEAAINQLHNMKVEKKADL